MTFEELLQENPALRYLRSLNADMLRALCRRQRGECTWCGQKVGKGRRTFCSEVCATSFLHRCSPGHAAIFVQKRDKGICRMCGTDTLSIQKAFDAMWKQKRQELQQGGLTERQVREEREVLRRQAGYARGRWFEIDHEIPVSEGGVLCDPEQLRLLCGRCHHEVTTDLQARAAKRRGQKK